jgi:hypothetical protein
MTGNFNKPAASLCTGRGGDHAEGKRNKNWDGEIRKQWKQWKKKTRKKE